MKTITVSTIYNVKCFISEEICLTECGKYINTKKGIELKTFLRGNKPAIYINGSATLIENLKPYKQGTKCPF